MEDAAEPSEPATAAASSAASSPELAAGAGSHAPRPKRTISQLRSKIDTAVEEHAARQARATREIERLQRISNGSWEAGKSTSEARAVTWEPVMGVPLLSPCQLVL